MIGEEPKPSPLSPILFALFASVAFGVVITRLYGVQIQQGSEFTRQSWENFVQTKRLEHARGEILDRQGRVLVTNRPSFNVTVTPAFLPNTVRALRRLGWAVGLSRSESKAVTVAFSRSVQERGPPILLARDLPEAAVGSLRRIQAELDVPLEAVPIVRAPATGEEDSFAAYLDPETFPSVTRVFRRLETVMGLDEKERVRLNRRARHARGLRRYREITVRRDVLPAVAERVTLEVELGDLAGVAVRESRSRDYRYGKLAAHLLGYVNELSPRELEARREQGYRLGDLIGRRGVERAFEEELRGVDGFEPIVVDSRGRAQHSGLAQVFGEGPVRSTPQQLEGRLHRQYHAEPRGQLDLLGSGQDAVLQSMAGIGALGTVRHCYQCGEVLAYGPFADRVD